MPGIIHFSTVPTTSILYILRTPYGEPIMFSLHFPQTYYSTRMLLPKKHQTEKESSIMSA